jgi:hypothetical protein
MKKLMKRIQKFLESGSKRLTFETVDGLYRYTITRTLIIGEKKVAEKPIANKQLQQYKQKKPKIRNGGYIKR